MQHQETIAPDHDDPLHELLEDLGDAPTIDELLGKFSLAKEEGITREVISDGLSHDSDGFKQTPLHLLLFFANTLDNLPGTDTKGLSIG